MQQIELQAEARENTGKGVKFLRRSGITPTHLFGGGISSMALQCDTVKLERTLRQSGHTRLINLKLRAERRTRPVLVREIQRDALTGKLLHVDFYQVKMGEIVAVEVPLLIAGEAAGLKLKDNMLMQEIDTLRIECVPDKIPPHIQIDISSLVEAEQELRVKDIKLAPEIQVLTDPEQLVVKVIARPKEKVAPEAPVAQAPAEVPLAQEKPEEKEGRD